MRRTTKGLLFSAMVLLAAMPALAGRHGRDGGPGDCGPRYERSGPSDGCFDADARREWREEHREARDAFRDRMRENRRNLARADTPREERLAMRHMRRDRLDYLHDRWDRREERRDRREACRNVLRTGFSPEEAAWPAPPESL